MPQLRPPPKRNAPVVVIRGARKKGHLCRTGVKNYSPPPKAKQANDLPRWATSRMPEHTALRAELTFVLRIEDLLRQVNPAFAKETIMAYRRRGRISDEAAEVLIHRLSLTEA